MQSWVQQDIHQRFDSARHKPSQTENLRPQPGHDSHKNEHQCWVSKPRPLKSDVKQEIIQKVANIFLISSIHSLIMDIDTVLKRSKTYTVKHQFKFDFGEKSKSTLYQGFIYIYIQSGAKKDATFSKLIF